tara:strand:- start:11 stop:1330 length:1320 start_codon:yes stop_codon:yes gene_type:complete
MSEIWALSMTETAAAIRAGRLSSREVVTAALERIAATDPVANAFESVYNDALDAASAADAARSSGEDLGPLHGVPVALKSNHDVAGYPTTSGVAAFANLPPAQETSPVGDRLRESGAIIIGVTRMPSGGFRWSTESDEFGVTRNPWDPTVTAGASSGGAAVAVAVGAVPLAMGNDIGGSIRYPSTTNGVMGLRPTVNRVPNWLLAQPGLGAPNAARSYCVDGPIARTVDDLRVSFDIIGRPDPRDPDAADYNLPYDREAKPRIGVVRPEKGNFSLPNTPEVDGALDDAVAALSDQGYQVAEVSVPQMIEAAGLWFQLAVAELDASGYSDYMRQFAGSSGAAVWEYVLAVTRESFGEQSLGDAYAALQRRSLLRRQVSEFMVDYPVLLCAASGEPPFPLGADAESLDRCIELIGHQWAAIGLPTLALPVVGLSIWSLEGH